MPHTDFAQPPLRSDRIVNERGEPILRFITFLEALDVNDILDEAELIADSSAQGALSVALTMINSLSVTVGLGAEKIVTVTGDYTQLIDDDILLVTTSCTITMLPIATAVKSIMIKSDGSGTVDLSPNGSETIELSSLTAAQSIRLVPGGSTFSWVAV